MNPDTRMEEAQRRMSLRPAVRLEYEGQLNDDPNQRAEYPRMLYRKTTTEQTETLPGSDGFEDVKVKDKSRVINLFDGLLCDTVVAYSATEAEALAETGWDVSPKAAHGMADGLIAATSAKDDEIAALRAQLAARDEQPERRGPGRPPKPIEPA